MSRRRGRARIRPATAVGGAMVAIVLFVAFLVPLLPGYDPSGQDLQAVMQHPLQGHLLGTDPLGRDIFSRLSVAIRTSLGVIGVALAINIAIGVGLGTIAGYFGGLVESVIMGLADLQLSIPLLILLVTVISVVGPSATTLAVVIGLSYWIGYGRVCRVIAASLRNREFVLAARTPGRRRVLDHAHAHPAAARAAAGHPRYVRHRGCWPCWRPRCPTWVSGSRPRPPASAG